MRMIIIYKNKLATVASMSRRPDVDASFRDTSRRNDGVIAERGSRDADVPSNPVRTPDRDLAACLKNRQPEPASKRGCPSLLDERRPLAPRL
ncbi:hypothetical protein [Burkholderia pseudomultivorans]|uniref:hypothetical protein n=1 Tax=Burkholderia pseudomultivorans TaxID=1207504 RepID=UPI001581DEB3|nr:hypothetical protein [Burkholderia pseudomultivorans]